MEFLIFVLVLVMYPQLNNLVASLLCILSGNDRFTSLIRCSAVPYRQLEMSLKG